ncbi:hypothetical protein PGT21_011134 [Puccinia graminis f. sp. tritici]|uniref:Secreted protein n=1 Tax=Puccinia graminis f. sp. tritici TaxID=56615 RepID=A0A5B0PX91_PUCGR|nr:hypothetical protein PGT21_011134 [Puccinia graminis f. sp. tritici]KAA1127757.1 hypothetical protein PGTUg99_005004 [Puccinia graminis f. sp. tritici]
MSGSALCMSQLFAARSVLCQDVCACIFTSPTPDPQRPKSTGAVVPKRCPKTKTLRTVSPRVSKGSVSLPA